MMSSKKRLKASPEVEQAQAVGNVCTFDSLPPEIILHILSNLSHGDVLWNRLVCTKWNDVVKIDPKFLQKSLIRVCPNSENKKTGRDILKNSSVRWKHLQLVDVKYTVTGEAFPVEVPLYLRAEVQTLKISYSNMSWNGYQHILAQFPALKELKIRRSKIFNLVPLSTQSEFQTVLNGLTSLSISDCEIPTTSVFLIRFQQHLKCLTTLVINAHPHDNISVPRFFYEGLFKIILGNSKSLKNLEFEMTIGAIVPSRIKNNFENVLRGLNESPTASSSLNLDTICFLYELSSDKLDLEVLVQFLKINKNVKKVCLPDIPRFLTEEGKTMVKTIMTALPKDIVKMDVPHVSYFQAPHIGCLFHFFDKLQVIYIGQEVPLSHRLLQGFVSSRVRDFGDCRLENVDDFYRLAEAFPNLVHLKVTISSQFANTVLQYICGEMRLLVSLNLTFDGYSKISDSGITGIDRSYCDFLRRCRPESLGALKQVPAEAMIGNPISSLRRLEKLVITVEDMRITDVGLCFGFRFARLKHLSLRNTGPGNGPYYITPVGLNYLADFNKCLERVTLDKVVSKFGRLSWDQTKKIEDFKLRLDRCKHFRINITLWEHPYVYECSSSSEGDDSSDDHSDSVDSIAIADDSSSSSSSDRESEESSDDSDT